MGLDPEFDEYEEGDECPSCVDILFDGVTPKYVEADISGIIKCPMVIPDPPNGTVLLTQTVPCTWKTVVGINFYEWILGPASSMFTIYSAPTFVWFVHIRALLCCDAFVNSNVCGVGGAMGDSGYATIWWGPTIGP